MATVGAVAGLALLAGCAEDAPQDTWQPAGDNAQKIQDLQWPVFAIAGVVLLTVFTAVAWCVFATGIAVSRFPSRPMAGRRWRSA